MTQPREPALLQRLVGVPKRLFTRAPSPRLSAPERVTSVGAVVIGAGARPRLRPGPAQPADLPARSAHPVTVGSLALKRPWPRPERENLFRDDFDI
ncbi:MAG: hypothetical protein AAGM21_01840 [Pseudomonadota bacterium]